MSATFGQMLREFRTQRGLSQSQMAQTCGVSTSSLQSYEYGRRSPDAAIVERISAALSLPRAERRKLRVAAGLNEPPVGLLAAKQATRGKLETIWGELEAVPWPAMVTNERKEIVAWNSLANLVGELDLATLSQSRRSVLRMAATEHYARHLLNWDELVGRLISLLKDEGSDISEGPPAEYVQAIMTSIATEDPRFVPRIYDLYLRAEPWRPEWRNVHPIRWRLDDGTELAFHGVFADWSDYDGLWAFDWHPADAVTATWIQHAKNRASSVAHPLDPTFASLLRERRRESRWSRAELAGRSGVSVASIAAYERETRSPSREVLLALCQTLTIDTYLVNSFLRQAGFEEEPSDFVRWMLGGPGESIYHGRRHVRPGMARAIFAEADGLPYPCFVLDEACHVVHFNSKARRILDRRRWPKIPGAPGPHLVQIMTSSYLRERLLNWDEVASRIVPGRLDALLLGAKGPTSHSRLRAVGKYVRRTDPIALTRLQEIWADSQRPPDLKRPAVQIHWITDEGDLMLFDCTFSNWNAHDPYKTMDLFPGDATTFAFVSQ